MLNSPEPTNQVSDAMRLVERLRRKARSVSEISRGMAESKSLRQADNPEGRTDLYLWTTPEQTDEWQAADAIEAMTQAKPEQQSDVVGVLNALENEFSRWLEMGPDAQPHYQSGMRPFSTGDLKHFVVNLSNARALLAALDGETR